LYRFAHHIKHRIKHRIKYRKTRASSGDVTTDRLASGGRWQFPRPHPGRLVFCTEERVAPDALRC
jgi:hypothetical protein